MNLNKETLARYTVIGLLGLTLLMSAAGALSLVWMRQQISRSALVCKNLEVELTQLDRRNSFMESKIAQAQSPEFLKAHVAGRLQLPAARQIVWANIQIPAASLQQFESQPYVIAYNLPFVGHAKEDAPVIR